MADLLTRIGAIKLLIFNILLLCLISKGVEGIKCYNCNHTLDDVFHSNPGCEYASPPEEYLTTHVRLRRKPESSYCFLITVRSNGRTIAVYRNSQDSLLMPLNQNLNEKCIDLIANPNPNIQAYIQRKWNSTGIRNENRMGTGTGTGTTMRPGETDKTLTTRTRMPKEVQPLSCANGTLETQNITIFGCYCDSDGCNGANFQPSSNDDHDRPVAPAVVTVYTCHRHNRMGVALRQGSKAIMKSKKSGAFKIQAMPTMTILLAIFVDRFIFNF